MEPEDYAPSEFHEEGFPFVKHIFMHIGAFDSEEEYECAQQIELLPEVEGWVRNLSRRSTSFWLPTATDKFYPDFVARLTDGRILVVEYKSTRDWSNDDSREKRHIGELWANRSDGKCLFLMPCGPEWSKLSAIVRS
jgi:type III restriction enzyme